MTTASLGQVGQRPPSPGGEWQGALLSVLVHAALVAVLLLGFRWQAPPPSAASAELWAAPPQIAQPETPNPPVQPPQPTPKPPPPEPTTQQRDADIALEQARKAKAEQDRQEKEKLAREQRERRERAEKAEKAERAEKAARQEKARQAEAAQKAAQAAQAERDAKARQEAQRREQAAADKAMARQREENLARMMGQLGGTATGSDARGSANAGGGTGQSASYAGRLIQAIKPNIVFAETVAGNPAAEVEVRTGPGGTIIGSTLIRSSGLPEWDSAVLRAVERTGTLPKDTDGRVPPRITITFRPKD